MNYYQKSAREVCEEFSVKVEHGLSLGQAESRLATFGANLLAKFKKETLLDIFVRQFKSPLIYILIFAAILVLLMGDVVDAIVILAVIVVNSVVGMVQEGKARDSLDRLKLLTRHKALIRRDGQESLVLNEELVCGDILILHAGDRVPADARILTSQGLSVDESVLTGEAYPVSKTDEVINKNNLVIGDQKNMVFSGCGVVLGSAEAVIVATGLNSELGKISREIAQSSQVSLPLAAKIDSLSRFIVISILFLAVFLIIVGLFRGFEFRDLLGVVIGLAVSVVPEGLPVAVTIVLARGVWRMAKKRAIVRQMAAVEAMGDADALLVDKTGTLTTGRMVITQGYFSGVNFSVSGEGYKPKGEIKGLERVSIEEFGRLLELAYLSLSVDIMKDSRGVWRPTGDPTEASIAVLARKMGFSRERLEKKYKLESIRPFDLKRRFIESVFLHKGQKRYVFVGAPEFLTRGLKLGQGFLTEYERLASLGLRVVGAAVFDGKMKVVSSALFAIDEEIRSEAAAAIAEAKAAGLRVVMLTGDFPATAIAIAREVGIIQEENKGEVIAGAEIDKLTDAELMKKLDMVKVFARITPEHKLRIANLFKKRGYTVAMTGDGVNDAPALQAADLGIGLGSGTQVAKDSSDIVLVNDSFKTIVDAIGEGRAIYMSLRRIVLYLLSTSLGEVLFISMAIILGLPMPLVAVQIIWLNFVTDGFLVVAIAQQEPKGVMLDKSEVAGGLVDKDSMLRILLIGGSMLVATMFVYLIFLENHPRIYAGTMALLVLSVTQWYNALNVNSRFVSIFKKPVRNNFLLASLMCVFVMSILAVNTSIGNKLLHTVPISLNDWLLVFGISTLVIWVEEVRKMLTADSIQLTADSKIAHEF